MGVGCGLPQIVEMTDRDRSQYGVFRLPKDLTGPLTELLDRLAAGCVMAHIHVRQQANIFFSVFALEPGHCTLTALGPAGLTVLGDHSCELLTGIAADLH